MEPTMEPTAEPTNAPAEAFVEGIIDEIKDFMFIINTDTASYAFPIEEGKPDMSSLKKGDKIKVIYTGELSEIDPFTGEVISVEKVQ